MKLSSWCIVLSYATANTRSGSDTFRGQQNQISLCHLTIREEEEFTDIFLGLVVLFLMWELLYFHILLASWPAGNLKCIVLEC